jgi:hypothetical protein
MDELEGKLAALDLKIEQRKMKHGSQSELEQLLREREDIIRQLEGLKQKAQDLLSQLNKLEKSLKK